MSILDRFLGKKITPGEKSKGKTCHMCGTINPLEVKFCSGCGSEFHIVLDTFDAFISYRRDTGSELASLLKIQLENRFRKAVFLDVNELQVGRFDEELLNRIENTPNFIVILSKASLERCVNKTDWLKREIMHAIRTERNIIPVMTEGFTFPSDELWTLLPSDMRLIPSLNGINYSHIHQDSSIRKIASYMKTWEEIPAKQISPPYRESETVPVNSKPHNNDLKKTIGENHEDHKKGEDITPSSVRHRDIPDEGNANSEQQKGDTGKSFRREIKIGTPIITGKPPESNIQNPVKFGSIRIESVSSRSESRNYIRIGKIRINKI